MENTSKPRPPLSETLYPGTLDCVHCGLCLSSCPTYLVTGRETSSPRGRVYLMRAVAEGRSQLGSLLAEESRLCLGCRACETACPAGVEYGALLENTREAVANEQGNAGFGNRLERFLLRSLVPHPGRLRAAASLLELLQRLRLDRMAAPLLPKSLRDAQRLAPRVPRRADRLPLPERTPAKGEFRGRVAFLEGCIAAQFFGDVNRATVELLSRNGFEVQVPASQGCCGALQAHAGEMDLAKQLALRNVRAFETEKVDAIVVNSAGCGAAMRDASRWLGTKATGYADHVRDVAEFLDEVGLRGPLTRVVARVCYDDPCHLVHGQGVEEAPRRLLASIPGLELIEHRDPSACCGAAGTYNLTQPLMSQQVLSRKVDSLLAATPDLVASGNPGCLMQLAAGLAGRSDAVRVVHPVELLLRATPVPDPLD